MYSHLIYLIHRYVPIYISIYLFYMRLLHFNIQVLCAQCHAVVLTIGRYLSQASEPINTSCSHLLYLGIFPPLIGWCNITVRHMTSVKIWIQITILSCILLFPSHNQCNSTLSTSINQHPQLLHPTRPFDCPTYLTNVIL